MALFEVPGWKVPDAPVAEAKTSRKRKRTRDGEPGPSTAQMEAAKQNVQKMIAALGTPEFGISTPKTRKKKGGNDKAAAGERLNAQRPSKGETNQGRGRHSKGKELQEKQTNEKQAEDGRRQKHTSKPSAGPSNASDSRPAKKQKQRKDGDEALRDTQQKSSAPTKSSPSKAKQKAELGLTALQANMKSSLDGARFRSVLLPVLTNGPSLLSVA